MVYEISKQNTVLNHFLAEIRDIKVQQDALRFRKNMKRISFVLAYEMSKQLNYAPKTIQTPLAETEIHLLEKQPIIASILRAGLTMHHGFLDVFDQAENAFISAYREKTTDDTVRIKVPHASGPSTEGKTLILVDPMLATGKSMLLVYEELLKNGTPSAVHFVCAIASRAAVEYVEEQLGDQVTLWVGAIDPDLNEKSYIVPGLGDAGDLAYGTKLDL